MLNLEVVIGAYLEAAKFTDCDPDSKDGMADADFSEAFLNSSREDCRNFVNLVHDLEGVENITEEALGNDFWLTRNRHGAGFWDRGLEQLGDDLSFWADTFSTVDLYLGDDGLIYAC